MGRTYIQAHAYKRGFVSDEMLYNIFSDTSCMGEFYITGQDDKTFNKIFIVDRVVHLEARSRGGSHSLVLESLC